MALAIGFTEGHINTHYAPLAALAARYRADHTLEPLAQVEMPMKTRAFSPACARRLIPMAMARVTASRGAWSNSVVP